MLAPVQPSDQALSSAGFFNTIHPFAVIPSRVTPALSRSPAS